MPISSIISRRSAGAILAILLGLSLAWLAAGCEKRLPPNPTNLAGTWQSLDGQFTLNLRPNRSFTMQARGRGKLLLGGLGLVADAGQWSVSGGELSIDMRAGAQMAWKIQRLTAASLTLKFGTARAVTFVRK